MKTTPKPRATKNRRGELVGPLFPPPPPPPPLLSLPGRASGVGVGEDMIGKYGWRAAVSLKCLLGLERSAMEQIETKQSRVNG